MAEKIDYAHWLRDITVREISLVDDPASEDATIEIVKMAGGTVMPANGGAPKPPTFAERLASIMAEAKADETLRKFDRMQWALRDVLVGIIRSPQIKNKQAEIEAAVAAYTTAIKDCSEQLVAKSKAGGIPAILAEAELADALQQENQMDLAEIQAALDTATARITELEKGKKAADDKVVALTADIEKLKGTVAEKDAEIAKAKSGGKSEAEQDEEFLKSLAPAVRARIEKERKEAAEVRAKVEKMEAEKEEGVAIAKAKTLGFGDAAKIGPALARIEKGKGTADDAKAVNEALAQAAGMLKAGGKVVAMTKAIGADIPQNEDSDPEALLKAKATEIQKANAGMTYEAAYSKAVDANPVLYQEYMNKHRAKRA